MRSQILLVLGLAFCVTPWASPPLALLVGLFFGAIASHPYPGESQQISEYLHQAAVVGVVSPLAIRAGWIGIEWT